MFFFLRNPTTTIVDTRKLGDPRFLFNWVFLRCFIYIFIWHVYIHVYIYIFVVVQDFWTIIRTIPIDRFEWRPLTGGFVPLSRTSFRWIIGGSPADSHNVCCLMWIFVYCIRMCDLIWIYLIIYIYIRIRWSNHIYIHMINLMIHVHIHNTPLELFWWDCGKLLASNFESFCMRLRCSCGAPLVVMTQ